MVTLVIDIPDKMLAFIDRQVAAGRALDRSDYIRKLLETGMLAQSSEPDCYIVDGKIVFANDEQLERCKKKMEVALDEFERGEITPWVEGDCVRMGREYLAKKRQMDRAESD